MREATHDISGNTGYYQFLGNYFQRQIKRINTKQKTSEKTFINILPSSADFFSFFQQEEVCHHGSW